jgi:hypothetical protein
MDAIVDGRVVDSHAVIDLAFVGVGAGGEPAGTPARRWWTVVVPALVCAVVLALTHVGARTATPASLADPALDAKPGVTYGYWTDSRTFYVAFPVRAADVTMSWTTATVVPIAGLSDMHADVLPATAMPLADEPPAATSLDTVYRGQPFVIEIQGTVDCHDDPGSQQFDVQIAFRSGSTIRVLPIRGAPRLDDAMFAGVC